MSPKPPSSGEATDWAAFEACLRAARQGPSPEPQEVMKIVIFDEADYAYARQASARYPELPVVLQPGNHTPPGLEGPLGEGPGGEGPGGEGPGGEGPGGEGPREDEAVDHAGLTEKLRWLVEKTTQDRWFEARVLPQLHVMLWGNKRGV